MRRNGIATLLGGTALSASLLLILAGCSLLPQLPNNSSGDDDDDDEETSEVSDFKARDLEDLFDPDDAPSGFAFDLDYSTEDISDWADEVEGYWDDSNGSEADCFDSYAASFILGGGDDGEHVHIALNDSPSGSDFASVDARVFDDADAAEDYFDVVSDAADDCSDADGYQLVNDDDEVTWEVSGVSVDDADDLDLPDGVNAIIQEEDVDADFAEAYRVIMLQRGNVIIAVTVEPFGGDYDEGDGDELAELIAEQLADLD